MTQAMPEKRVSALTPLRIVLATAVLTTVPFAWIKGEPGSTWAILAGYVMPALVVMLAWGVLLDMLMIVVFRAGREAAQRTPYHLAFLFDGALLAALLASWGPFYLELLRG